jgi:D-sedoheptulose 7-phosphate isomerase
VTTGEFAVYCGEVRRNMAELEALAPVLDKAVEIIVGALAKGGKVIFCGNGGSAADSQHLAAELMGRFLVDREPLPAIALTVDTSALTAIANDYSYDEVFSRQLRGIGGAGDVLVGISTSGNSRNVVNALRTAKARGLATIGLTGSSGGAMADVCDVTLRVPSERTNHIQEMHIVAGHFICSQVERRQCQSAKP